MNIEASYYIRHGRPSGSAPGGGGGRECQRERDQGRGCQIGILMFHSTDHNHPRLYGAYHKKMITSLSVCSAETWRWVIGRDTGCIGQTRDVDPMLG